MEMDLVMQFINPELAIIIAVCYVLGLFLKSSHISDWLIPFILLVFAILLTIVYIAIVLGEGFTAKVIVTGLIQGLLAASLAVYGNQLIKQVVHKRE